MSGFSSRYQPKNVKFLPTTLQISNCQNIVVYFLGILLGSILSTLDFKQPATRDFACRIVLIIYSYTNFLY